MRYADRYLAEFLTQDFVARQRMPTLLQFLIAFIFTYALILGAQAVSGSFKEFALIVFLMLACAVGGMVWSVQRSRDLVLITEFQNAIFSSALGVSSVFCMIARQDGAMAHVDARFRALFPQVKDTMPRYLSDILGDVRVPQEDIQRIYAGLAAPAASQSVIPMQDGEGKPLRFVLSIDPLRAPKGYALLRGRPFVERT